MFLFTILFAFIAVLVFQLMNPDTSISNFGTGDQVSKTAQISNFYGKFSDERLAVELSWNINEGNKTLSNLELKYGNDNRKDVTDLYSLSMPLETYHILTGNNEFELIATFSDDTVISKTVYVYINEAYDFSVSTQHMDMKSIFSATYYFDKQKPLSTPSVFLSGTNENFTMNFISSEKIEEKGNRIQMRVVYELNYNDVTRGDYALTLTYSFPEYNLDINYPITFRVANGVVSNE